jgi:hypothetical protein
VSSSLSPALDLCRGLLAYTKPDTAVPVPHAALAELVRLATGSIGIAPTEAEPTAALPGLHDVAALCRRYNRARTTVRQWFHDGLFGPPEERLFRRRGYVASDDAVREFEHSTGLRPVRGEPVLSAVSSREIDSAAHIAETPPETTTEVTVTVPVRTAPRRSRTPKRPGGLGSKIAAAAGSALRPPLRQ